MQIAELVKQFEEETLPANEWTHHAHLAVCIWYVWHYPIEELPDKLRTNIKKYNTSVGGKNTDNSGYHETITMLWLCTTKEFIEEGEFSSPEEALDAMLNSERSKSDFTNKYYSKQLIKSVKARKEWVMPDLQDYNTWGLWDS